MPLPNAERAVIPARKLTDYLLSDVHPRGKEKARYLGSYGFTSDTVHVLEDALRSIAMSGDLVATEVTEHGTKYIVVGLSTTPTGRMIRLRTVWIVEPADQRPRFVTAYRAR